jgi:very-short-patch-repair endonuclease
MPELPRIEGLLDHRSRAVRPDAVVARLAAGQHGVVARRQLIEAGLSPTVVRVRVAKGVLIPLHPGVYAVGHRQLRVEGHWLAAVLAAGPGAVLSHREAAALHGLRPSNRPRIDVTTVRRGRTAPGGVDLHETRTLGDRDLTAIDAIPVTTVARTLVDLAGVVSRDHLAKALREAEHQRTADLQQIEEAMRRTRNRPGRGHATLRAVLQEHAHRGTQLTRSVLEDRFAALLDAHDLPRARINAHVEGYEVDAFWPHAGLVVELDGWERHRDRHAFQRDREKGNALTAAGLTVLRFTHDDVVNRPADVAGRIGALLAGSLGGGWTSTPGSLAPRR